MNITLPQAPKPTYERRNVYVDPAMFLGEKTYVGDVALVKLLAPIDSKNYGEIIWFSFFF
jgi:hypothetical protein